MINTFFGLFSHNLAIDLGTSNTLVYVEGKGIVIREPTIIARVKKSGEVVAVGTAAKKMLGRSNKSLEVIRPLKDGLIADSDATIALLSSFIKKIHAHSKVASHFPRPKVVVGVPGNVSDIHRKAVADAFYKAGARKVTIIDEALAVAIGSKEKIEEGHGIGVIDIGGGTTDIALVSSEKVIFGKSIPIAGDEMDQAIVDFMRLKYSLLIGEVTAEQLKINIGTATPNRELFSVVRGRSLEKGLPKSEKVGSLEIHEVLLPIYEKIADVVINILEEAPPELSGDVSKNGFILAGGGALTHGISDFFEKRLGVSVSVVSDPLTAVVRGCAKLLEE